MRDTISQLVLFNVAPDFKIQPLHPVLGQLVIFNASATRVYQNTSPSTQGFLWNFGDGTNGTGIIADHNYRATGPYRVLLTTTTGQGNPTISKILVVGPSPQGGQPVQTPFYTINLTIYGHLAVT